MKKGFIINPDHDMADFADFADEQGLDGIELMYWEPTVDSFGDLAERKRILADHNVQISALGLWRVGFADPAESGHADAIKAGIDFAAELGASCFFAGAGDPVEDDKVSAFAQCYPEWKKLVEDAGMEIAVYLGHQGSYIFSDAALAETVARVPDVNLKLDPVGFIRNLKTEPLYTLSKYGANLAYFHVKGLLKVADRELEPPPGLDELPWAAMFGILHEFGYDGWVVAEPHGRYWGAEEKRKQYVKLTFQALAPYML